MNVEISVIMSVYNGERWLSECIESILNQTYKDFEFIIVNDGSNDSTLNILSEYSKLDSRILIFDKANTGLADSLNFGIKHSTGKWIARIDADDICEPNRLEYQLQFANKNKSLVLIGSGLKEIDEQGSLIRTKFYPEGNLQLKNRLNKVLPFFPHSSAFILSHYLKTNNPVYRPRIKRAQDFDLWLRLSEIGSFGCIKEPLVRIRKHPNQISHEDNGKRQIIDSRVSLVSYFIRNQGGKDPVDGEDSLYLNFKDFVSKEIDRSKIYEYYNFIMELKLNFKLGFIKTIKFIIKQENSITFMLLIPKRRIFGEDFAKRTALKWIKSKGSECAV